jgi:hypothetical protein
MVDRKSKLTKPVGQLSPYRHAISKVTSWLLVIYLGALQKTANVLGTSQTHGPVFQAATAGVEAELAK